MNLEICYLFFRFIRITCNKISYASYTKELETTKIKGKKKISKGNVVVEHYLSN